MENTAPLQVGPEDVGNNINKIKTNEMKNETSFETSLKQVLKQADYMKLESIITWLVQNDEICIQDVMNLTKKSRATAWRYMQKLLECDAVEVTGSTNNIVYRRKN
jgi:response regulator of citrate/malate metabolism